MVKGPTSLMRLIGVPPTMSQRSGTNWNPAMPPIDVGGATTPCSLAAATARRCWPGATDIGGIQPLERGTSNSAGHSTTKPRYPSGSLMRRYMEGHDGAMYRTAPLRSVMRVKSGGICEYPTPK